MLRSLKHKSRARIVPGSQPKKVNNSTSSIAPLVKNRKGRKNHTENQAKNKFHFYDPFIR